MDYAAFRSFRDAVCAARSPLRLDCMNPTQALSRWPVLATRGGQPPSRTPSLEEVLASWARLAGEPARGGGGRWLIGRGVRDLLGALLPALAATTDELWLPDDVYPVYWELAGPAAGARPFAACGPLGASAWTFLERAAPRAVVLCPLPLSPLGRMPAAPETRALARWLSQSPDRLLLVDAVYAYDPAALIAALEPLRATSRCAVLHSLAKSHLAPGALGVSWLPPSVAAHVPADALASCRPDPAAALHALTALPALPRLQAEAFARQWRRLAPAIEAACPGWRPPESGYFSLVPRPFEVLLEEHDLLAVPASVFGSPRADYAVITCLHDLVEHERGAGAVPA